ncbi:MAG: L-seryl-tRNA(Sec) selenium transferase [Acidobacteria bacterium]|nr:L-seryl-tRNA(Sec) selenium transferase [Acidobacteriota bacterium]
MPDYRVIPSIEQLRQRPGVQALVRQFGHSAVVEALRAETDALRQRMGTNPPGRGAAPTTPAAAAEAIEAGLGARLRLLFQPSLCRVINATGVIVHTNLGRAPLSPAALAVVADAGQRYVTLEYDVVRGERGHRDQHAEQLLCRLTGAESAVVVNNCAAATLLMLAALASGREVIVSRGELVEIGGGFRVPEVMAQSGALLREVGTTNRTRASDYAAAISDRTALILRVHRSNFTIEGFTEQPSLEQLVAIGRERGVTVAEDLGSGNILGGLAAATDLGGLRLDDVPGLEALVRGEPTVQASISAGIGVLCFSGDKLLGGPQAGIIVGRRDLVQLVRRHPLMRALRVDKLTYAALAGTLTEYAAGRARESIPVVVMLTRTPAEIESRARRLADALRVSGNYDTEIIDGRSTVGGGTTPGLTLPTRLLALTHRSLSPDSLESALRQLDPPIIGRIDNERVVLDLRTVFDDEDDAIVAGLLTT